MKTKIIRKWHLMMLAFLCTLYASQASETEENFSVPLQNSTPPINLNYDLPTFPFEPHFPRFFQPTQNQYSLHIQPVSYLFLHPLRAPYTLYEKFLRSQSEVILTANSPSFHKPPLSFSSPLSTRHGCFYMQSEPTFNQPFSESQPLPYSFLSFEDLHHPNNQITQPGVELKQDFPVLCLYLCLYCFIFKNSIPS